MDTIKDYIDLYEGQQRDWLVEFTNYMEKEFPNIPGAIWFKMPTYKFDDTYIAFSIAKTHFTFHTLDFDCIIELKSQLPKASFGKGCAKVKYTDTDAKAVLFQMCHQIVEKHSGEGKK